MRGRKPLPTEVKILNGNPGRRPLNEAEPKPRIAIPRCPESLTGEARQEWRRITKELIKLGLLTRVDMAMLAMYCQAWATWVTAEKKCAEIGNVVETTNGNLIQSPWRGIASTSMKLCQSLAAEFGLSPSSRSRVKGDATGHEETLVDKLFKGVQMARENRSREAE